MAHKGNKTNSRKSGRSRSAATRHLSTASEARKYRALDTIVQPPRGGLPVFDTRPLPPSTRQPVSTFRRTYTAGTISASVSGDTINAWPITLSSLPGSSEFTALFDQYRILEVSYSFIPYFTEVPSTAGTVPGIFGSAIDYDDANFVLGLSDLQQYDSYQRINAVKSLTRVVRPRSAVAMYSGAFTSFGNVYGQWIDSASPSVQHYGLKTVLHGSTFAANTAIYELEIQVVLQCRSQH
jgi:hypothetical protein